jgi:hypothetical protein
LGTNVLTTTVVTTIAAPTGLEKKYLPVSEVFNVRGLAFLNGHEIFVGEARPRVDGSPHLAQTSLPPMLLSCRV